MRLDKYEADLLEKEETIKKLTQEQTVSYLPKALHYHQLWVCSLGTLNEKVGMDL